MTDFTETILEQITPSESVIKLGPIIFAESVSLSESTSFGITTTISENVGLIDNQTIPEGFIRNFETISLSEVVDRIKNVASRITAFISFKSTDPDKSDIEL